MEQPRTKPPAGRLRRLRDMIEAQPGLVHELSELLDWSPAEIAEMLRGEIELELEDRQLIDRMMMQQQSPNISEPPLLAA